MATEVTHTYVGQYQYSETEAVMANISNNFTTMNYTTNFEIGTSTREGETDELQNSMTFTDISIKNKSGNFSSNEDYYVRVEIPEDNCYDNSFLIKLINDSYTSNSEDYQFIMSYSVPKSASESSLYSVALYKDASASNSSDPSKDGVRQNRVVALEGSDKDHVDYNQLFINRFYATSGVIEKRPGFVASDAQNVSPCTQKVDRIYFTKDEYGEVRLWRCTAVGTKANPYGTFEEISRNSFSVFSMYASWDKDTIDGVGTRVIEFLFRPETSNFNQILFQLVRNVADYGIINSETTDSTGNKTINYGRVATIKSFEIYEMYNLIARMDAQKPVNRIGIWGHPEQIMGINGEQILIGPSGYYELSDYTIRSLSVVAKDFRTGAFTLDYTWQESDQKER